MNLRQDWVGRLLLLILLALLVWGAWSVLWPASPRPTEEQWREYREGGYPRGQP